MFLYYFQQNNNLFRAYGILEHNLFVARQKDAWKHSILMDIQKHISMLYYLWINLLYVSYYIIGQGNILNILYKYYLQIDKLNLHILKHIFYFVHRQKILEKMGT